jgi:AAA15 family ATPase/GTPase
MLVEFRVKNFKSIRDEQVLSMAASGDKSHADTHVIHIGEPKDSSRNKSLKLLKSAVIYGPNASGKSNLIEALSFMQYRVFFWDIMEGGGMFPFEEYYFKLDRTSKDTPSEFEVTFFAEGTRYQYGFSLLGPFVAEEWLLAYKAGKPQEWFSRRRDKDTGKEAYRFSSYFKGQKSVWQKSTHESQLFLSVAIRLNSEQLSLVSRWFLALHVLPSWTLFSHRDDSNLTLLKDETFRQNILSFLKAADLGIADVTLAEETGNGGKGAIDRKRKNERPVFIHKKNDGTDAIFEFVEESEGTQRFFDVAFDILKALQRGRVLVLDEIESSLHPLLSRFIVAQFNSGDNRSAQLIFSTHDTNFLNKKIFRRDQIWFVEKDESEATTLFSLSDFSPRKDEALESGYLTGRYGAIPFLTDLNLNEGH